MDLILDADEYHLLTSLKEEKMVSPKKTPKKRTSKNVVEEVGGKGGGEKSLSSSEFDDVVDVDYAAP